VRSQYSTAPILPTDRIRALRQVADDARRGAAAYSCECGRIVMGLLDLLRPKAKIADIAGLADFLDRQSAFMVQKCIYEYARARSGRLSVKLLEGPAFREAAERAKWRNYPLCLQSAALMVEGALRAESQRPDAMRAGLAEVVGRICRLYP